MYESMIAGPAYCAAAAPVRTKMPAPMMAPIPNVTRFTGPKARFRLCSPTSLASRISMSRGLVANKLAIHSPKLLNCGNGFALGLPGPYEVNRDSEQHDDQPCHGILRLVAQ